MTKAELNEKLTFHRSAVSKLREAYVALVEGGVQQYTIGSRSLTKLDLSKISNEINAHEKAINDLETILGGRKRRKAVGIVPRDW